MKSVIVDSVDLFTRCSPSRVYSVLRSLTHKRREIVREMGFGSLLRMKKFNLRRELVHWLLERFDPTEGSLSIGDEKFTLNSQIFGKILCLEDGGDDLGDLIMDESCKRVMGERISLNKLEEQLKCHVNEHLFVRNLLQFLCGTFLLPSTSLYVVRSLEESLKNINDPKVCRSKNWVSTAWRFLVEGVRRYKERRSHFVCGCVYFFQLFYLNKLEGHNRYVDKSVSPANWWTEKEIRLIFEWIHESGGFDKALVSELRQKKKCKSDRSSSLHSIVAVAPCGFDDMISEIRVMRSEIDNLQSQLRNHFMEDECGCCNQVVRVLTPITGVIDATIDECQEKCLEHRNEIGKDIVIARKTLNSRYRLMCERYFDSCGRMVGPFNMSISIEWSKFLIAVHVFQSELSQSDVLYRHQNFDVVRLYFGSLLPNSKVDLQLVGAYVIMVRYEELMKYSIGRRTCVVSMPIRKRNGSLVDIHHLQQSEVIIPLTTCAKVVVPILDFDEDHWILVEFDKLHNSCGIWDSVGVSNKNLSRLKVLKELANFIDNEISTNCNGKRLNSTWFSDMTVKEINNVQKQQNNTDCGIFVMKFIDRAVLSEKVVRNFDPYEERLHIALKIITSLTNDLCSKVIDDARNHFRSVTNWPAVWPEHDSPLSIIRSPIHLPSDIAFATKKKRHRYWSRGRSRVVGCQQRNNFLVE